MEVRKRVPPGVDPEDLLQLAMLRAAERLESLRASERVEAWFYRVLRNTIADHHEQRTSRDARLSMLATEMESATAEQIATCACSLGVLAELRPEYREIVRRVDVEEESVLEAAVALAISPNNAAVRLHRGRKALRTALLLKCGTTSVRACLDCDGSPPSAAP